MVLLVILLYGMYQAGYYDGLRDYCPEPNMIVEEEGYYTCLLYDSFFGFDYNYNHVLEYENEKQKS